MSFPLLSRRPFNHSITQSSHLFHSVFRIYVHTYVYWFPLLLFYHPDPIFVSIYFLLDIRNCCFVRCIVVWVPSILICKNNFKTKLVINLSTLTQNTNAQTFCVPALSYLKIIIIEALCGSIILNEYWSTDLYQFLLVVLFTSCTLI